MDTLRNRNKTRFTNNISENLLITLEGISYNSSADKNTDLLAERIYQCIIGILGGSIWK